MALFRRRGPVIVGTEPVDDFYTRFARNPQDRALLSESADWQWIAASIEPDEKRWVRAAVRFVDVRSARGFVLATDKRIFLAWGTETRAFPLEHVLYVGENPSSGSDALINIRAGEGPRSVKIDVVDVRAFEAFYPTVVMLVTKARERAGVRSGASHEAEPAEPSGPPPPRARGWGDVVDLLHPGEEQLARGHFHVMHGSDTRLGTVFVTSQRVLLDFGATGAGANVRPFTLPLECVEVVRLLDRGEGEFTLLVTDPPNGSDAGEVLMFHLSPVNPTSGNARWMCENVRVHLPTAQ